MRDTIIPIGELAHYLKHWLIITNDINTDAFDTAVPKHRKSNAKITEGRHTANLEELSAECAARKKKNDD
jgi:hypothetical protein